jgi:hypothetical protein
MVAGTRAQIKVMRLPDPGSEAQGDQLQQSLGDHGPEDKDFTSRQPGGRS